MYGLTKKLYGTRQSVHASTDLALSGEKLGRRQALEAIAGTAIGLKSLFSTTTAEAADWGIGVHAIKKVIPAGNYVVRRWEPELKTDEPFLYIISKPGQAKVPFGEVQKGTVTNLEGVMTPEGIEKHVLDKYSSVAGDPYSIEVQKEKLKNGEVIYIVRKRVVIPRISADKLYLEGPGTAQSGGGGAGGAGGAGGSGGKRWMDIMEIIKKLR